MSFRILRGFVNTAAYDSKIIIGGKLKAGWRCITECFDEFVFYSAFLFPFVVAGNHYAHVKPTLERLEREVLEGHNRVTQVLWTREDTDVFGRRMEIGLKRQKTQKGRDYKAIKPLQSVQIYFTKEDGKLVERSSKSKWYTLAGICLYLADEEIVTKPVVEERRRKLQNLLRDRNESMGPLYKLWREHSEEYKIKEEEAAKEC